MKVGRHQRVSIFLGYLFTIKVTDDGRENLKPRQRPAASPLDSQIPSCGSMRSTELLSYYQSFVCGLA